jgi:hypothetical protein
MDREVVRSPIRAMLETGTLPCDDAERTWGGRGGTVLRAARRSLRLHWGVISSGWRNASR